MGDKIFKCTCWKIAFYFFSPPNCLYFLAFSWSLFLVHSPQLWFLWSALRSSCSAAAVPLHPELLQIPRVSPLAFMGLTNPTLKLQCSLGICLLFFTIFSMQKMTEKSQFCAPALASCRAKGQFPNTVLDATHKHPQIPAGYMVLGCGGRWMGATQSPFLQ